MAQPKITLTPTTPEDLPTLFHFQQNPEGIHLAAFTAKDPNDEAAYMEKYTKLLADPTINNQTIWIDGVIVGSVAKYEMEGDAEITYWIDRKFWGQGIATKALREFLKIELIRPIFGRAAFDNYGSQKVMENCGFVRIGTDRGFANARQEEIEEIIYKLSV
jgi:RimJ/RimL family protein N-acetyltransferase